MSKLIISRGTIKDFRQEFDERLVKYPIVCKEGCSYCCYQFVSVLSFETPHIAQAIKELKPSVKKKVFANFITAKDHFEEYTKDMKVLPHEELFGTYAKTVGRDWIACPLLVDNKCSIYESRPFVCQLHYQTDDSQLCKQDNIRNADDTALALLAKFIEFLLESGTFGLKSLLHVVGQTLDKKTKLKTIEPFKFTKP